MTFLSFSQKPHLLTKISYMKYMYTTLCMAFLFATGISGLYAQETISASGGDASGSGGSSSYSLGQLVTATAETTDGSVAAGVQQPYEIFVVSGIDEKLKLKDVLLVYPNPTHDFLTLKVNYEPGNILSYQLINLNGKLLETKEISGSETSIDMSHLDSGTYFLKVTDSHNRFSMFKIIKN